MIRLKSREAYQCWFPPTLALREENVLQLCLRRALQEPFTELSHTHTHTHTLLSMYLANGCFTLLSKVAPFLTNVHAHNMNLTAKLFFFFRLLLFDLFYCIYELRIFLKYIVRYGNNI